MIDGSNSDDNSSIDIMKSEASSSADILGNEKYDDIHQDVYSHEKVLTAEVMDPAHSGFQDGKGDHDSGEKNVSGNDLPSKVRSSQGTAGDENPDRHSDGMDLTKGSRMEENNPFLNQPDISGSQQEDAIECDIQAQPVETNPFVCDMGKEPGNSFGNIEGYVS